MKLIGNIIWIVLVGWESFVAWMLTGLLWCITIIGIPFGMQCFKFARMFIWPFGSAIHTKFFKHPIANTIWLIFGGFCMAVGYVLVGLLLCITIIGIPFGKQCFKLARLAVAPFGADIG